VTGRTQAVARAQILAFASVCALASCERTPSLPAPEIEVLDSAGVLLVRVPPLSAFGLPEWRTEPILSTRDIGGEELELYRVVDALFLEDSSLVLANAGSSEVIIVQGGGQAYRRTGGEGDGPGEFRSLSRLLPASGGGFFAFDWRLTLLDQQGEFVETRRLDPTSFRVSVIPLAAMEDRSTVAVLGEQRNFRQSGERRDTVPLLRFSEGVAQPDTIGTWLGLERAFATHPAGRLLVPIGFARTAFHASNGVGFVIGSTDSLDLTVFSSDLHPTLRLVAPPESRTVSHADVRAWREYLAANLPVDDPGIRSAFEAGPVRERFPGFDGLELDGRGRIWVGEYLVPGAKERRWVVFSEGGRPIGQVRMPAYQSGRLPGRTELLAVGADRIAILRTTRLDEEYVEVWRFYPAG